MKVEAYKTSISHNSLKYTDSNKKPSAAPLNIGNFVVTIHNAAADENNRKSFLLQNNINFGATRIKRKDFPLTTYRDKISCPCCGEKMINSSKEEREVIAKQISEKRGKELADFINDNIDKFQASRKELARKIAIYAPKYPESNVSEIMGKLSNSYVHKLRKKQLVLLNEMANELKTKSNKCNGAGNKIKDWQHNQTDRIMQAKEEGDFTNKYLIGTYSSLAKSLDVNISDKEIQQYFERMPNSKRDLDAFVVKYERRPAQETAYRMLKDTNASIEHIIPFSETSDNGFGNILLMCSDCNSARGSISYKEFIELNPDMQKNVKKYLLDIEAILKDNTTSKKTKNKCKNYIRNVSQTLNTYTKGSINF